jgi:5-methylcytosine-specific restriction endonuclease McrA
VTEKKKHPGGCPTKYNPKFHPLLAESLARNGLTDVQMAERMGICEATITNWKKQHPEFLASLKSGKEEPNALVERSLFQRAAKGFEYDEVTYERIADSGQKKRHGGVSKFTAKDWEYAQAFFGGECCYCGAKADMTKDHVIPLNMGGELERDNVVPACTSCNCAKQDTDMEIWYRKQKFFKKARLDKINAYIDEMKKVDPNDLGQLVITKIVKKKLPPDVTAQIYWTKNRDPNRWREKQEIEHSGRIVDGPLTPEERTEAFNKLMQK